MNISGCVVVSMLVPASPVQAVLCPLNAVVGCGVLSVLVIDGLLDALYCGSLLCVVALLLLHSSDLTVS